MTCWCAGSSAASRCAAGSCLTGMRSPGSSCTWRPTCPQLGMTLLPFLRCSAYAGRLNDCSRNGNRTLICAPSRPPSRLSSRASSGRPSSSQPSNAIWRTASRSLLKSPPRPYVRRDAPGKLSLPSSRLCSCLRRLDYVRPSCGPLSTLLSTRNVRILIETVAAGDWPPDSNRFSGRLKYLRMNSH